MENMVNTAENKFEPENYTFPSVFISDSVSVSIIEDTDDEDWNVDSEMIKCLPFVLARAFIRDENTANLGAHPVVSARLVTSLSASFSFFCRSCKI